MAKHVSMSPLMMSSEKRTSIHSEHEYLSMPELSMPSVQILKWAAVRDEALPYACGTRQKQAAASVLLSYGLVLRKGGLFKIAQAAWDFAQNANVRHFYEADAWQLSFLALQASRCVHHANYDPSRAVLDESDLHLINAIYRDMDVPSFENPLDLFYYYRLQLIDFPCAQRSSYVVHVDFCKKTTLEWSAPCPCHSHIPYGECCGLYL